MWPSVEIGPFILKIEFLEKQFLSHSVEKIKKAFKFSTEKVLHYPGEGNNIALSFQT